MDMVNEVHDYTSMYAMAAVKASGLSNLDMLKENEGLKSATTVVPGHNLLKAMSTTTSREEKYRNPAATGEDNEVTILGHVRATITLSGSGDLKAIRRELQELAAKQLTGDAN